MRKLALLAFALASASVAVRARADDGAGARLRLQAYFAAKDDDARKTALDALSSEAVPADFEKRVRLVRDCLALPSKKALTRFKETFTGASGEGSGFVVTPEKYDPKKMSGAILNLHGHGDHANLFALSPFTLPPEVLEDMKVRLDEEIKKQGLPPGRLSSKMKPDIFWQDGLVLAPVYKDEKTGKEQGLDEVEATTLALLEKAARGYAVDPDRVTLAGLSLGAAYTYEIGCRHPDRFAALLSAASFTSGWPFENLRPLQVWISHGEKDPEVPVKRGRDMDEKLKAAGVTHVYAEVPNLDHRYPRGDDGAKVKTWLKARVRTPWPASFKQTFDGSKLASRVFWVEVPQGAQAVVQATAKDNTIDLKVSGTASLVLHLGEPLVDLEKEVVVRWGDVDVYKGKIARSWKELLGDLEANGFDLPRAAPGRIEIKSP